MTKLDSYRTITMFDVPVKAVTMDEVMSMVNDAIVTRESLDIGVVNVAKIVNMKRNPELRDAVLNSDVIFADGAGVVLASKLLGEPLPCRIAGIDLMWEMYKASNTKKYRVFCFGATEEINTKVADIIHEEFPDLLLVGRRNGYYDENEEERIANEIAATKPDILLVAMTSPKKEKFMANWSVTMNVPVVHGVGGSFDVMAGKVKRAPELWQKFGMEWLYRVKQEPGRLWKRYLITNSLFFSMLIKAMFKKILSR